MPRAKKPTLLERALSANDRRASRLAHDVTAEEIDLAFAWLRNEITLTQINRAMFPDTVNAGSKSLYRVAVFLRVAFHRGRLRIVDASQEAA